MEKNYYIFVANDISLQDKKISVMDIKDDLLANDFWSFAETAPLKGKLKMGDEVLIYLAGRRRGEFIAAATTANYAEPIINGSKEDIILSNLGIGFLKYKVALKNVRFLRNSVKIVSVLEKLKSIREKKSYGLHLRQPIVHICPEDYGLILSHGE